MNFAIKVLFILTPYGHIKGFTAEKNRSYVLNADIHLQQRHNWSFIQGFTIPKRNLTVVIYVRRYYPFQNVYFSNVKKMYFSFLPVVRDYPTINWPILANVNLFVQFAAKGLGRRLISSVILGRILEKDRLNAHFQTVIRNIKRIVNYVLTSERTQVILGGGLLIYF